MDKSDLLLRDLEKQGDNTLFYVLVIVVLLLLTAYIYNQYESSQKIKVVEVPAPTKEIVDLANSLKTGATTIDTADVEGDVDAGLSFSIESLLDTVEKTA